MSEAPPRVDGGPFGSRHRPLALALAAAALLGAGGARAAGPAAPGLAEARQRLVEDLTAVHGLTDSQAAAVRAVLAAGPYISQGNPAVTRHPASPEECRARLAEGGAACQDSAFQEICGAPYMAPLYDPEAGEGPGQARSCIDQFEFPDIPCAYPVVWVRAREAALLCQAMGKRLCDAHEWEGACAGRLAPPDYRFDLAAGKAPSAAVGAMRAAHNQAREADKGWSYGPEYRQGLCGAASAKSPECPGGSWARCGSNTYPAGFFPDCRSRFGVYDLHGNAAEHMNLPLAPEQMASRGSAGLGYTEMKGSWFIFDRTYAHPDWCRWRAPFWHGSRVMDAGSHHNYHLGFRCCKSLEPRAEGRAASGTGQTTSPPRRP